VAPVVAAFDQREVRGTPLGATPKCLLNAFENAGRSA
jgi:hypothetical protein